MGCLLSLLRRSPPRMVPESPLSDGYMFGYAAPGSESIVDTHPYVRMMSSKKLIRNTSSLRSINTSSRTIRHG